MLAEQKRRIRKAADKSRLVAVRLSRHKGDFVVPDERSKVFVGFGLPAHSRGRRRRLRKRVRQRSLAHSRAGGGGSRSSQEWGS